MRYGPKQALIGGIAALLALYSCSSGKDWRTASRESAGIAPDPALTQEAVKKLKKNKNKPSKKKRK